MTGKTRACYSNSNENNVKNSEHMEKWHVSFSVSCVCITNNISLYYIMIKRKTTSHERWRWRIWNWIDLHLSSHPSITILLFQSSTLQGKDKTCMQWHERHWFVLSAWNCTACLCTRLHTLFLPPLHTCCLPSPQLPSCLHSHTGVRHMLHAGRAKKTGNAVMSTAWYYGSSSWLVWNLIYGKTVCEHLCLCVCYGRKKPEKDNNCPKRKNQANKN